MSTSSKLPLLGEYPQEKVARELCNAQVEMSGLRALHHETSIKLAATARTIYALQQQLKGMVNESASDSN